MVADQSDTEINTLRQVVVELEKEIDVLRRTNNRLNERVGDEDISGDDKRGSGEDLHGFEAGVNTKYYQRDYQFAAKYYYITNVSSDIFDI